MPTDFLTLYNKVLVRLDNNDGRALYFAKEAINDASKWVARVKDFDELLVWSNSVITAIGQASYNTLTDWFMARTKDVYSIVYYTGDSSSVKLEWMDPQEFDQIHPYPTGVGNSTPRIYTQKGQTIYLHPAPDQVTNGFIYYSRWPDELVATDDETEYEDIDDVLITLATDIARANLTGVGITDWTKRATQLLSGAVSEHATRPDARYVARPFRYRGRPMGEYWKNPMVKSNP